MEVVLPKNDQSGRHQVTQQKELHERAQKSPSIFLRFRIQVFDKAFGAAHGDHHDNSAGQHGGGAQIWDESRVHVVCFGSGTVEPRGQVTLHGAELRIPAETRSVLQ